MKFGPAQALLTGLALLLLWVAVRVPIAREDAQRFSATAHGRIAAAAPAGPAAPLPPVLTDPAPLPAVLPPLAVPARLPGTEEALVRVETPQVSDRRGRARIGLARAAPTGPPPLAKPPAPRLETATAPGASPLPPRVQSLPQTAEIAPTLPPSSGPAPVATGGYAAAEAAYAALARTDRRAAAEAFEAALAAAPDHPNAAAWEAELGMIDQRWHGWAYALVREGGGSSLAASPRLGASQAAAELSWRANPRSRAAFDLFARIDAPLDDFGDGAQLAVGGRLVPVRDNPRIALQVERLVGLDDSARDAFALRLTGGGDHFPAAGARGLAASGYGEAGVIGLSRTDAYVGGQAAAGYAWPAGPGHVVAGAGAWGYWQEDGASDEWRLDVGPSVGYRLPTGRAVIDVRLDYRARIGGDARPGSGVALTVGTSF